MLYVIQRGDGEYFTLADDIDPNYAEAFIAARKAGVAIHAWQCHIDLNTIKISTELPVRYK